MANGKRHVQKARAKRNGHSEQDKEPRPRRPSKAAVRYAARLAAKKPKPARQGGRIRARICTQRPAAVSAKTRRHRGASLGLTQRELAALTSQPTAQEMGWMMAQEPKGGG
jgi:hypothetical protein